MGPFINDVRIQGEGGGSRNSDISNKGQYTKFGHGEQAKKSDIIYGWSLRLVFLNFEALFGLPKSRLRGDTNFN